jgi:hypothetical protein
VNRAADPRLRDFEQPLVGAGERAGDAREPFVTSGGHGLGA